MLRAVVERNQGPLTDEEMVRLFREIMSACLAQEEPLKIGYLGPEGTFTQSAVYKHFGHSVRALPLATIDEVFHEVEGGAADFGGRADRKFNGRDRQPYPRQFPDFSAKDMW